MADIRISQPSYAGGVLSPELHGRVDLAKYAVALREAVNVFVHPTGGVSNRAGMEYIADALTQDELGSIFVPFEADGASDSYVLEFVNGAFRIIRNGALVVYPPGHEKAGQVVRPDAPYSRADLAELRFTQSNDVLTFVHPDHEVRDLTRYDHHDWRFTTVQFGQIGAAPTGLQVVAVRQNADPDDGYRPRILTYVVSAIIDGRETLTTGPMAVLNDLSTNGNYNVIGFNAVPGAEEYRVYKEVNGSGLFGFCGLTIKAGGDAFRDYNVVADGSQGPQKPGQDFTAADSRPSTVEYFQQRRIFASTRKQRQSFFGTRVAQYDSMAKASPAQDDDAFEFTLNARKRQTIKHILALDVLILFTQSAEWIVSGQNGAVISGASPPLAKPQSYWGSSDVPPLLIGDEILFIEVGGNVVRNFGYAYDRDKYAGEDLTILARHLFEGRTITSWAYARDPHSVIWVTLDSGQLLSMTYMREQQVWAWAEHETAGYVERVATAREGRETAVYLMVKRSINGGSRRTVERMHTRALTNPDDLFFVDCGLTYQGEPATVISGLDHLEGAAVVGVADGAVFGLDADMQATTHVVSNGRITLDAPASLVNVGLPYSARIATLPLEANVQGETTQGTKRNPHKAVIRFKDTRGVEIGTLGGPSYEPDSRTDEPLGEPPKLFTGNLDQRLGGEWNTDAGVTVEQRNPLPFTVLSITATVDFSPE